GFITAMVPDTWFSALTEGNILQVLVIAVLTGIALAQAGAPGQRVLAVLEDASAVVFRLVALVMRAAPLGAFGAMAFTVGKYGLASLANL
ncbi:cation:dicarboxylase symporter family transporter, partial [Acinetobacter baumannii]